jgi:AcrR family transcriptional regulator
VLDHAVALFIDRGLGGVSVKAIADAADVFPSQLTYYFGSKDALFVEAACREVLHIGSAVEKAGSGADSPPGYVEAIVNAALEAPSLLLFAEAMSVARFNHDLQSQIEQTLDRLYSEGARAVSQVCQAHGWTLTTPADVEARAFWSTVIGVALQQAATASRPDPATAQAVISLFFTLHPEVRT